MARVAVGLASISLGLLVAGSPDPLLAAGQVRPGAESWVRESPLRTSLIQRARQTRARLNATYSRGTTGISSRGTAHCEGSRLDATVLNAGASVLDITPQQYETWNDSNGDATYQPPSDTFNDSGVDRRFDYQETGAFGSDGKPGKAGVDDDRNGVIDDSSEYLSTGTDDVADPARDN